MPLRAAGPHPGEGGCCGAGAINHPTTEQVGELVNSAPCITLSVITPVCQDSLRQDSLWHPRPTWAVLCWLHDPHIEVLYWRQRQRYGTST
jgi:hypothetical protein